MIKIKPDAPSPPRTKNPKKGKSTRKAVHRPPSSDMGTLATAQLSGAIAAGTSYKDRIETHCPTCGKRFVALTAAEKQRAYRERRKAAVSK